AFLVQTRHVTRGGQLDPELFRVASVRADVRVDHAAVFVVARAEDHRARAVAEDHRDVASRGGDVEAGGGHLRTDEQHVFVNAGADPSVGDLHAVHEAAALIADVERGYAGDLQERVQQTTRAREVIVRRKRRKDDRVDVFRLHARHVERAFGGELGEIRGA